MLTDWPLGKKTTYVETYSKDLLFPVPRALARRKIGLLDDLPFRGVDIWNGYEVSWLNLKGKPVVALARIIFPCTSPNVVESKSLKLYLNSFNQSAFESLDTVCKLITADLSATAQEPVFVELLTLDEFETKMLGRLSGTCLDGLDIQTDTYQVYPQFLKTRANQVEENLYSDLLKSNCLATGQPDWASVLIHYKGKQIDHEGLLKYIISFRNHSGFAEHCAEQIFHDIERECSPTHLTVYLRTTRRGGLDINPFRSNFEQAPADERMIRQ